MVMKITLDPGHTKNYNSGIIPGYYEGNTMFKLATLLKTELEKYENVEVFLTKDNLDKNPSLKERGNTAIHNGSELFISLHSNAYSSPSTSGVVGFYSIKLPQSKALLTNLLDGISSVMCSWSRGATTRKGSNGDWYGVIRNSIGGNIKASFLIEHGFHTNKTECNWLMQEKNLQKLAETEARIIAEYYGLKKKPTTLYRVQVGAYENKENAEAMLSKIQNAGFKGYIKIN